MLLGCTPSCVRKFTTNISDDSNDCARVFFIVLRSHFECCFVYFSFNYAKTQRICGLSNIEEHGQNWLHGFSAGKTFPYSNTESKRERESERYGKPRVYTTYSTGTWCYPRRPPHRPHVRFSFRACVWPAQCLCVSAKFFVGCFLSLTTSEHCRPSTWMKRSDGMLGVQRLSQPTTIKKTTQAHKASTYSGGKGVMMCIVVRAYIVQLTL